MTTHERALLLAAQQKAITLLSDAAVEADSLQTSAHSDAVALLKEQQAQAERLLKNPAEDPAQATARAEALLRAEKVDAESLHDEVERRAVEILLAAQREAAAILLEARMALEDKRRSGL